MKTEQLEDISRGERFDFGSNWNKFLGKIDEKTISEVEASLKEMLEVDNLAGKSFLDIGSGSGLFSLAARRLGAKVYSFDYDPVSVQCTRELKARYCNDDNQWDISEGSVLDENYIKSLGEFDIVYSWGVLHHTGNMRKALENAAVPVKDEGVLYISIYNDQGALSGFWTRIKKMYCRNRFFKVLISCTFIPVFYILAVILGVIRHKSFFGQFKKDRGMSFYYDCIDWLGGFPFEVAKPELIFDFYKKEGFLLQKIVTTNGQGCNSFVFRKK